MNDLEQRLRATYQAVAEQTVVAEEHPRLHDVEPTPLRVRSRRPVWIGLAVAASLIAALVVVLTTRHPAQPAGDKGERSAAVPIYVPQGFAYVEGGSTGNGGVPGFDGAYDGIRLVRYQSASASFVIASTAADALPAPGDRTATLLSGVTATITGDTGLTTIAWAQPDGPLVGIKANGLTDDELVKIANSLWYITPKMFERLTAHGGFLRYAEAARIVDQWQPPGDKFPGSKVGFSGSLQTGVQLRYIENLGRLLIDNNCRLFSDHGVSVVYGPGTTTEFVITQPSGDTITVAAAAPPGLPTQAAAVLDRLIADTGVQVQCIGGGS